MQNFKQYRIVFLALAVLVGVLVYFAWKTRSHRYTLGAYENDRVIAQNLGINCQKFVVADIVGRSRRELEKWVGLENTILLKGEGGRVHAGSTDPEFAKEVHERLVDGSTEMADDVNAESGESIETQTYTVCGLRFAAIIYGDKIVDAVFISSDKKGRHLFGIEYK